MKKALYVVSEKDCLIPGKGCYRHITIGIQELNRFIPVDLYIIGRLNKPSFPDSNQNLNTIQKIPWYKKSIIWNTFRDFWLIINNHKNLIYHYKEIKRISPAFMYERVNYLQFTGIILSKILNIPHFYENNGIKFYERKRDFPSLFFPIAFFLERLAYNKADFTFFIGSWGNLLNSRKKNWMNIENGVERSYVEAFKSHNKHYKEGETLHICFIGSLMPHHRFDVLIQALRLLREPEKIHLHLFGSNFEGIIHNLTGLVSFTDHGFVNRDLLKEKLTNIHVGILPGSDPYPSNMKIFDYGGAKCMVLAPRVQNLTHWFSSLEIQYFDNESSSQLAVLIENIVENPSIINTYGEKLYEKINRDHTWDNIFNHKFSIIKNIL